MFWLSAVNTEYMMTEIQTAVRYTPRLAAKLIETITPKQTETQPFIAGIK